MAIRMGVGFGRFPFEDMKAFRRWLDACEEGGIDSIWQSDRVLSENCFFFLQKVYILFYFTLF